MARFTTSDGLRLHYTDEGAGLPLLCLSGLTRDGRDFDYLAPHLPDLRLIRLDYRGRGQSDWAEDVSTYAVPREAQDTLELLDHLSVESAAILGTSRGGLIAMVLASTVRERVRGVALNDVGPVLDPKGIDVILAYLGRRPPWKTLEEAAAARPAAMAGFANVPQSRWREEVERLYVPRGDGLDLSYDPRLRDAVEAAAGSLAPDLWPLFDAMEGLPLATIRGANSDILSPATLAEMRRRRPDMIVAEIADRGHIPFLDEPAAVAALKRWLEAIDA